MALVMDELPNFCPNVFSNGLHESHESMVFCHTPHGIRKVFAFSDSDGWPSPRGMVVTSIKRSLHMYIVHRQTSEALLCYNF